MANQPLQGYRGYLYLTLALLSVFGLYLVYERRSRSEPIQISTPMTPTCLLPATPTVMIRVHVIGAVSVPGVYTLPGDARVIEAVQAAGGMASGADPEAVNLAEHLYDGQQVYIPLAGAPPRPSLTPVPPPRPEAQGGASSGDMRINLNTASAAELERLPGIGAVLAERIVAYREEHGPFTAVEQIMAVEGIGEACYARIRDLVTLQ